MTSWMTRVACLTLLAAAGGCADPLEAPSAYEEERYLCTPDYAAEFDGWARACSDMNAAGGACTGIVSLKGEQDGQHFVTETTAMSATYEPSDVWPNFATSLEIRASTPYFGFRLVATELVSVSDAGTACTASALFNEEVRGASAIQAMRFTSCEYQSRFGGLQVNFASTLSRGGTLDGCFFVMPAKKAP